MAKRVQNRSSSARPRRAKKRAAAPPPPPAEAPRIPSPEKPATLPWILLGLIALWVIFRVHHLATLS